MIVVDTASVFSEMRLIAGRVLISLWKGLDRHPFDQTLHNIIQQSLWMSALHHILALGDSDDLHTRARETGSRRVDLKPFSLTARFPNPR
jgi:hypothetical protein